ncbi:MAG: O-antigen ligase family protein [Xanthomonadaceae bacterium]|nr:O-antigen ligase family protein [Xanthomonadaceae bacterium]
MTAASSIPLSGHLAHGRMRTRPQNWPLYLFVVLIPLQNIYLQYIPNLGGGLNFINAMFALSLLMALRCRGGLVRGTSVNGWMMVYMLFSLLALVRGIDFVDEPAGHVRFLKDHLIAVSFLFLAQMSVTDWRGWRRLYLASLIPLPYMLYVVGDQNASVGAWHYSDQLRINGTFMELGANEMAAFFVTAALVALGFVVGSLASNKWRLLCLAAAGLAVAGVVLSYSRTAYVAILAAGLLLFMLPRFRMRLVVPTLLAMLVMPLVLPNSAIERFDSISIDEGERDESTENRFAFWETAKNEFARQPVLGSGFHTFHHAEINPLEMDTHNFFLRELVEKGIVGILILALLLLAVLRLCWRGFRAASPGSLYYGFMIGLLAAFVALLIGNVFGDRFTHYPLIAHFWLYAGLGLRGLQLHFAGISEERHHPIDA